MFRNTHCFSRLRDFYSFANPPVEFRVEKPFVQVLGSQSARDGVHRRLADQICRSPVRWYPTRKPACRSRSPRRGCFAAWLNPTLAPPHVVHSSLDLERR